MERLHSRRHWLKAAGSVAALASLPAGMRAAAMEPRHIGFRHLHTGETLSIVYAERGEYLPDALAEVNRFLRDHRTGEIHAMDPKLLDLLYACKLLAESRGSFEVFSGFRSAATNEALRRQGEGVAVASLHLVGQAIDVRLRGVATFDLSAMAVELAAGGVGYYPRSDFVHLDTGRVRSW